MLFATARMAPAMFSLPAVRAGMVDTLVEKVTALNLRDLQQRARTMATGTGAANPRFWCKTSCGRPHRGRALRERVSRRTPQKRVSPYSGYQPVGLFCALFA
ncbi:MAG: hypothetical protein U5M53_02295 [Rhodoferax sp.]|nr:hypothetical protein [Rhodoferax sp.]